MGLPETAQPDAREEKPPVIRTLTRAGRSGGVTCAMTHACRRSATADPVIPRGDRGLLQQGSRASWGRGLSLVAGV